MRPDSPVFLAVSLPPWGRKPALPGFTLDHRMLVVPNEASDNVSLVSLESLSVVGHVELPPNSRPWQAKVIPGSNPALAYVTNTRFSGDASTSTRESSTVSVIDISRRQVVREIRVGAGANGVTVDQRGRRGYVVNMRSDTVSVIDIARHEVIASLPVGRAPAFAKLSRDLDGRLLVVTNLHDASVTVIDTQRLEVLYTMPVGDAGRNDTYPEWGAGDTTGVAITEDGVAYLTNYRSHSLAVLDLSTRRLRRLDSPIRFPFFVEVERREHLVLFSSGIEKKFALLDARTEKWLGVYPSDGTMVPEGRGQLINLWMTDPANDRLTAILPCGLAGISADWDRNMVTKFM